MKFLPLVVKKILENQEIENLDDENLENEESVSTQGKMLLQ